MGALILPESADEGTVFVERAQTVELFAAIDLSIDGKLRRDIPVKHHGRRDMEFFAFTSGRDFDFGADATVDPAAVECVVGCQ